MADDYVATISTTGHVAVGSSTTGQLETVGDRDWFSVSLTAGNPYSFRLDPGAVNGLQDPYLRLFGIGGGTIPLAESDDANGLASQIDITITTTGTYYLEAGSGTNPDVQPVGTRMGNYVLSASTTGDDYAANVSTTGHIAAGGAATGLLETAGDSDWFSISLTAGKLYVFTLNSGTTDGLTDPLLSLYRSDGSLVTSNDDTDGLNSQIAYTATGTGTYYLGASSGANGSGTGIYTLNASLPITDVTPAAGDDYTANVATTGRIVAGGASTGQLETAGDSDWFAISLTAGKQYVFTLNSGTTDGLTDPLLSLYRSDGSLVTSNDDFDGLNSQITYTATGTGTFYLGASSGANGSGTGSYTLNASLPITEVPPTSGDDYSANVSTTGRISAGGTATGLLEIAGDSDWFAIFLTAGKQYVFTLNSGTTDGLTDPLLSLYRSDGSLVTSNDDTDGLNSRITVTATATGTYYLGASSGVNGTGTGSYQLNATLIADDYAAAINTTGQVSVGGAASGQLETAGDSDWFAISLTAGKQYTFALNSGTTNGLADPFLSLYNNSGTLITSDDDSNAPNAAITYTATTTGTYYLGASSSPNNTGAGTGSYSISALPIVNGTTITNGNDIIPAGAGDQTIDGGAGTDTVVFTNTRSSYAITKTATGYTVKDKLGTDGTDTLANIEQFQFSDRVANLSTWPLPHTTSVTSDQASLIKIFVGVLGMAPNATAMTWAGGLITNDHKSLAEVANIYLGADAGAGSSNVFGSPTITLSAHDYVEKLFVNMYGWDATAIKTNQVYIDGVNWWTSELIKTDPTDPNACGNDRGQLIVKLLSVIDTSIIDDPSTVYAQGMMANKLEVGRYYAMDMGGDLGGGNTSKADQLVLKAIIQNVTADQVTAASYDVSHTAADLEAAVALLIGVPA